MVSGFSDNIRVTSIVGRFLEHSRINYFRNAAAEEIYLGSADLMRRNLSHRVEIIFLVSNPKLLPRLFSRFSWPTKRNPINYKATVVTSEAARAGNRMHSIANSGF